MFELPVTATVADPLAEFYFVLGQATGMVWIGNVHLQTGSRDVWRRDYKNGTVLVNVASQPRHISFGKMFRKIKGTQAPAVTMVVRSVRLSCRLVMVWFFCCPAGLQKRVVFFQFFNYRAMTDRRTKKRRKAI